MEHSALKNHMSSFSLLINQIRADHEQKNLNEEKKIIHKCWLSLKKKNWASKLNRLFKINILNVIDIYNL